MPSSKQNVVPTRSKSVRKTGGKRSTAKNAQKAAALAQPAAPVENEPPMWMDQLNAELTVDDDSPQQEPTQQSTTSDKAKNVDHSQGAATNRRDSSTTPNATAHSNGASSAASHPRMTASQSALKHRQRPVVQQQNTRPQSASTSRLQQQRVAPPTAIVSANTLSLGVIVPEHHLLYGNRRHTLDVSSRLNPLLQQSQRNRDVYERVQQQRKRHSFAGPSHLEDGGARKRKRPVVHIPTTNSSISPNDSPSNTPLQVQPSGPGLDSSPDASLRQIFRSSSPSLMKEISRLLGPQEYANFANGGLSPQSPARTPLRSGAPPPLKHQDSVGMFISRAMLHRSPNSPSSLSSKRHNTTTQNDTETNSPLSPFSEGSSEQQQSPTPTRELSSSPLSQVKVLVDQSRSSPKRARSPQAHFFNPESILNRTPLILQKRPKSTYLLERIVQERSSQDHYNRGSTAGVHQSGIYGESLSKTTAVVAAEIAKRRSSSVNLSGRLSASSSQHPQRSASSNMILGARSGSVSEKQVPSIRLSVVNSEPASPSSRQSDLDNTSSPKVQIIRPHSATVTRRKPSSTTTDPTTTSPPSRPVTGGNSRRASSVVSNRQNRSARGHRSSGIFTPGHFQSAQHRPSQSETTTVRAAQIDDIAYIRYAQTEKPRNQFSVRTFDADSHTIYKSRGAGFISARPVQKTDAPKWKSFERARSKKLRAPRPLTAGTSRNRGNQQAGGINNLLHIQSITVTKGERGCVEDDNDQ